MPPHPDSAARTHRPRGPSGAARGCEALFHPENHRVFRTILPRSSLRVDGKRGGFYPFFVRFTCPPSGYFLAPAKGHKGAFFLRFCSRRNVARCRNTGIVTFWWL